VILVHGGGSDRTGSRAHAELLARHGFGVLLYDSRGRGESEGRPNGAGWGWDKDVAGALTFLGKREDVDPDRIGALGLSTGANVLLEVAAERKDLNAVVADGAGMRSCADFRALDGGAVWLGALVFCTMFAVQRVFSGSSPGKPFKDLVARLAPTPLLLIAGGRGQFERDFKIASTRGPHISPSSSGISPTSTTPKRSTSTPPNTNSVSSASSIARRVRSRHLA
jgi:pimeloyl-ACP methyl ester carboxylesterase